VSFWKRIFGGEREPEVRKGQYGVDYVGVSEMLQFNRNLLDAVRHEKEGIELYTRFLSEAHDERGREMYQRLIGEEKRHLEIVNEEIEEHRKQGYWS
jgi:rubrerythrin